MHYILSHRPPLTSYVISKVWLIKSGLFVLDFEKERGCWHNSDGRLTKTHFSCWRLRRVYSVILLCVKLLSDMNMRYLHTGQHESKVLVERHVREYRFQRFFGPQPDIAVSPRLDQSVLKKKLQIRK